MHSCFYTIIHLKVKLRELVLLVRRCILDVTKRRGVYNVADNETLDRLILGDGLAC